MIIRSDGQKADLFDYEGKLVKITDKWGDIYAGEADYYPPEYCFHEYGHDEECIRIDNDIIYASQIEKIELYPAYEDACAQIPPGKYRHFKGSEYEVIGIARHSETEEALVVYRALYGGGGLWVRPAFMWNETVERDGKTFKRFEKIE